MQQGKAMPGCRENLGEINVPVQAELLTPGVRNSAIPTLGCRMLSKVLLVTHWTAGG